MRAAFCALERIWILQTLMTILGCVSDLSMIRDTVTIADGWVEPKCGKSYDPFKVVSNLVSPDHQKLIW